MEAFCCYLCIIILRCYLWRFLNRLSFFKKIKVMLLVEQNQNNYYLSFGNIHKFNVNNAQTVENELMEYIDKPSACVTLNMQEVSFIDSRAFETLLNVLRKAKINNTSFQLGFVSDEAMELIRLMELDKVFTFKN